MCCLEPQIEHDRQIYIEKIGTCKYKESFQIYFKGVLDQAPRSSFSRFFRRLDLGLEGIEKIAEAIDVSFHLFGRFLKIYLIQDLYQKIDRGHHSAHDIEHLIHSSHFFRDITRSLLSGKIFVYQDKKSNKIDYIRSISRLCALASHFFSTLHFCEEIKLCSLKKFNPVIQLAPTLNALGYVFSTIALIWDSYQGVVNLQFTSDLRIYLSGSLFESRHLITYLPKGKFSQILNKIASIAGIIHAVFFTQRLMLEDRLKGKGEFLLPNETLKIFQEAKNLKNNHIHLTNGENGCKHPNEINFVKVKKN